MAMRYRFYTTSSRAWGAMLSAISTAQTSIYLEMYIFENDTVGYDFLSELINKAQSGVQVVVILDAIGSFGLATAEIERLRSSGAEVLFFSYWFKRTHRKILIVDEYTVFLGGVNISGKHAPWKDLQMRLSGKNVSRFALRTFARTYRDCGGKEPILQERKRPALLKQTRLWFIEHGVGGKRLTLKKYYEEHIDSALHRIVLVTPYFIPHRWFIAHIHQAIIRGVRVEIIIPRHTDHTFIDRLNIHYLKLFSDIGASCYLAEEMNHAKAMLIDEREGTVGSHNLDALSFDWNAEASVFFDDPHMVADLEKIILDWKLHAVTLSREHYPAHWYDILLGYMLSFFQSVL